jgi:polysaccharide pyruvyl transferase CsaB
MRILIFAAGGDIGGGKTHILSLTKRLAEDNEVRLICFRVGQMSREAEEMGISTVATDVSKGIKYAVRTALEEIRSFRPDIIHCHGAKANMIGFIAKRRTKLPVISTIHSDPRLDYMGKLLRGMTFGVINAFCIRHMDSLTAVGGRMKQTLSSRGFDPYKIFTVFNGIDFSGSSSEYPKQRHPGNEIVIGIAARLNPVKDVATVIRAFALAHEKDERLRLSIAGTGEEHASLTALAESLGISDLVRFEGWIDDIRGYFRGIDINVLSSLSETFPYSLLEGACERCPAIATAVGGIPALIEHGVTGFLFSPGKEEELCGYILKLAADPALREKLGNSLYDKASARFSLTSMKEQQERIYETVLRRHARRARARDGVVICGAYGKGNAGDEAILKAILSSLAGADPDLPVHVMSRRPRRTAVANGVASIFIFDPIRFTRLLKRSSLFICGGGSLIQDATSNRSLYFYLMTLRMAKARGCRVLMYGNGMGPVNRAFNRRQAGRVIDSAADIITLRDSSSLDFLRDVGVSRPEIIRAADPVIGLPAAGEAEIRAGFSEEGVPADVEMAGFCLRNWPSFKNEDAVVKAAEYVYERYGLTPVFYPIERPKDTDVGSRIAARCSVPCYVCSKPHSAEISIGMLGSMRLVVGMRLHSLIFATAGGAPVIGLSYDVKVDGFLRDIGCDRCLPVSELTFEALKNEIDRLMSEAQIAATEKRDELRRLESENIKAAEKLLGRES